MIKVYVNKNDISLPMCSDIEKLTSGSQRSTYIEFEFSDEWDGLSKIATFSVRDVDVDVQESDWDAPNGGCYIPAEVMAIPGKKLSVGITGYSNSNNSSIVMPTVWATLGIIERGALPSGAEPSPESSPVWAQILSDIGDLSDLDTSSKDTLVDAINEAFSHEYTDIHQQYGTWIKTHPLDDIDDFLKTLPSAGKYTFYAAVDTCYFCDLKECLLNTDDDVRGFFCEVSMFDGHGIYRSLYIGDTIAELTRETGSETASKAWVEAKGYLVAATGQPQAVTTQDVWKDANGKLVTAAGTGGGTSLVYNVKDYGAIGNGETADSTAVQSALDACNEAGGGTVYFPVGTYLLDKPVKFYSNQYLLGEIGATLLQDNEMTDDKVTPANYMCNLMRNYNNGGNGYTVTHDVVIDGLTFDGGTQEEKATTMLTFCHTDNITVKNCKFTNGYSYNGGNGHDIESNSSRDVTIHSCEFSGNRRGYYTSELIQIDAFNLQVNYPWLPDEGTNNNVDSTYCDTVTICGCNFIGNETYTVSDGNTAIGSHGSVGSKNILISSNKFYHFYHSVGLSLAEKVLISNNVFDNCYMGMSPNGSGGSSGSKYCIFGNIFRGIGAVGVSLNSASDVSVVGNSFDCAATAVRVGNNSSGYYICSNKIVNGTVPYFINGDATSSVAYGNYYKGNLYEVSKDGSFANATDLTTPTTLAVKTYVDAAIGDTIADLTRDTDSELASKAWVTAAISEAIGNAIGGAYL